MDKMLLNIATVEEIDSFTNPDGYATCRVRARIPGVDNRFAKEFGRSLVPWAFPLLPKMLQTLPKVGEAVLVISYELDNLSSQRFFIGPIISQPQYNYYCPGSEGLSPTQLGKTKMKQSISRNDATRGAFPKAEDVAIVGRGKEDVVLSYDKNNEKSTATLRAGVREEPINNPNLFGNVIFNQNDPCYVQVVHQPNVVSNKEIQTNSLVNIVGGHINLMSNEDDSINDNLADKNDLVDYSKIGDVMGKLHPAVKGDKLIEFLNLLKYTVIEHVHPWAGLKSCGDWGGYQKKLEDFDVTSILSDYVHLS